MTGWNKNFQRLVWKHYGDKPVPKELEALMESTSSAFDNYEKEHALLNRIMDLSSKELFDANTELRKRNEELDRFVYSTSHDLRAPLTSILGLLQLIKLAKDDKEIEAYLDQIMTSTLRLDNFIQDIVSYTHNKKAEIEYVEIDFESLVRKCIDNLSFMAHADTIKKNVIVESNAVFISDIQRLDNLLTNLISNSIKYCNPEAKEPFINISITTNEKEAIIIIEDNGIGIKNSNLKKIFNMFYRASATSKGSGIGLYIVKEIVEKLSGSISATSTLGKGSSFSLTIPNKI